MAKLIKADGTESMVFPKGSKWTLDELQSYVGGPIELMIGGRRQKIIVNEEGRIRQLPVNTVATDLIRDELLETKKPLRYLPIILGDVLILHPQEKM